MPVNWWKENSLLGGTHDVVIRAMHLGQSPMLVTKSNTPQGERGVGATASSRKSAVRVDLNPRPSFRG